MHLTTKDLMKSKGTAESHHPNFPDFRVLKHPEKYFPTGVMGDPQLANREFGERANKIIADKLAELIEKMVEAEVQ